MSDLSDALKAAQKKRSGWSLRRISEEMSHAGHDVSFATIGVYLRGEHGAPEERVLKAFAAVFPELSLRTLRALAAQPAGEDEPYVPPAAAARLSRTQRAALNAVINAMLEESPQTTAAPVAISSRRHRPPADPSRIYRPGDGLPGASDVASRAPVEEDLDQLEAAANRRKRGKS